jgi:hypothetical protein
VSITHASTHAHTDVSPGLTCLRMHARVVCSTYSRRGALQVPAPWVSLPTLFAAMQTIDPTSQRSRGTSLALR